MSRNKKSESGEDRLIGLYFKPIAKHPGAFGLVDDAAAIAPPKGCDLVLKTDGIIGGVHFFPDDPPDTVAKKALRVNLSDLAAKGAKPLGFLLTLALPKTVGPDWLKGFARGLGQDADRYGCPLFGGDTDRTPGPITISIAAFGAVPHGKMVRRSGARVGDRVLVTGTIGDAALGLLVRGDAGTCQALGARSRPGAAPGPALSRARAAQCRSRGGAVARFRVHGHFGRSRRRSRQTVQGFGCHCRD